MPHESVDSQESLEMEEYSDEDDEVFVRHNIRRESENSEASKPLMKKKKRVTWEKTREINQNIYLIL